MKFAYSPFSWSRSRRDCVLLLIVMASMAWAQARAADDLARWQKEAKRVSIVRDDWGIAHISGKTDADAVFGMIYAQAEDDFNRIETNYLNSMGRLAEAEGESRVWQDLRMKLFINPAELKVLYGGSPAWLQTLMNAWADGLNYYLATHPEEKPRVIQHFEPWMALSFTEGSIGGDIERVDLEQLRQFYGGRNVSRTTLPARDEEAEPSGSNGIAIGPSNTVTHHALLLINPHTSFFFRSELQMTSREGLNAYGAVTWGQFFVYQGFNASAGWMHTSSGVDAVDEYLETITNHGGRSFYKYGAQEVPVMTRQIVVPYKSGSGMASRTFTVAYTRHGPVIRAEGGKWVSIQLMQKPVEALEQSYLRTKARTYADYLKTMQLQANSSNNTIFADADGDIAYFHGNFIPRRDTRFDFTRPVDGSDPATDWHGLLSVDEAPHLLNPKSGYLFNVNDSPWAGAGESSLRKQDYPAYVESGGETARGLHAMRILSGKRAFTLDSLMAAAYDSYLPWFDKPLPALFKAWDSLPEGSMSKGKLAAQIHALRGWDRRWAAASTETTLAVFWGTELRARLQEQAKAANISVEDYAGTDAEGAVLLDALVAAVDKLTRDFGDWRTPWGSINRFQRLTGDIAQPFSDAETSEPVPFTSAVWGSLASFGAKAYPQTKKWYGTSGNSFVAVVEFGPRVHARAVTAGGESGHPASKHFNDESQRYSAGNLRDVYFYPDELHGHVERSYHPGASQTADQ